MDYLVAGAIELVSAACYGASAALQHAEASRQERGGLGMLAGLVRRGRWWLAMIATVVGALLHLSALAFGPLTLVKPIGVTAMVFALPLGAKLGRPPGRGEWVAAACVVVGLAGALSMTGRYQTEMASTPVILVLAAVLAAVVLLFAGLSAGSAPMAGVRWTPVLRALAAATCFGFTSACARALWIGAATLPVVALALVSAGVGIVLSQLAYREGGLAAPLAILILVDPLVAGAVGLTALGESLQVTPVQLLLGAAGMIATVAGVTVLARAAARQRAPRRSTPATA